MGEFQEIRQQLPTEKEKENERERERESCIVIGKEEMKNKQRLLVLLCLLVVVYFVTVRPGKRNKQHEGAAKFQHMLDSMNLTPGDTVTFDPQ